MSGNNIILDSNIVIYLSQKKLALNDIFEEHKNYSISLITYMEILSYNFPTQEEENFVRKLLSLFQIIDISKTIANKVIELKKIKKIKLPDAIIVSTALTTNSTLYTNDKQLHTIDNLKIKYFNY